jgi:hypothetical protein
MTERKERLHKIKPANCHECFAGTYEKISFSLSYVTEREEKNTKDGSGMGEFTERLKGFRTRYRFAVFLPHLPPTNTVLSANPRSSKLGYVLLHLYILVGT